MLQGVSDGYRRQWRRRLSGNRFRPRRMYFLCCLRQCLSERCAAARRGRSRVVAARGAWRGLSGHARGRVPGVCRSLSQRRDPFSAAARRDRATDRRRNPVHRLRRLPRTVSDEGDQCLPVDLIGRRACAICQRVRRSSPGVRLVCWLAAPVRPLRRPGLEEPGREPRTGSRSAFA